MNDGVSVCTEKLVLINFEFPIGGVSIVACNISGWRRRRNQSTCSSSSHRVCHHEAHKCIAYAEEVDGWIALIQAQHLFLILSLVQWKVTTSKAVKMNGLMLFLFLLWGSWTWLCLGFRGSDYRQMPLMTITSITWLAVLGLSRNSTGALIEICRRLIKFYQGPK